MFQFTECCQLFAVMLIGLQVTSFKPEVSSRAFLVVTDADLSLRWFWTICSSSVGTLKGDLSLENVFKWSLSCRIRGRKMACWKLMQPLFGSWRILYGRMRNKTGSKTQGKSAASTRMAIVLRFLAGSLPEEIRMFLDLLFEAVQQFSNGR